VEWLKKNGLVEVVEANLRSVIQTAEAIAPWVLWIDEIEKGFSGSDRRPEDDKPDLDRQIED
jgi:SpoVK/Ycf46/Vps4 family AAA+-type ATPase